MDHPALSKKVWRKGQILKTITADILLDAVGSETVVSYANDLWRSAETGILELVHQDAEAGELRIWLGRNMIWLMPVDDAGNVVDHFQTTDDELGLRQIELRKSFLKKVGMGYNIWHVGRDIGVKRVED